jgi:16S rRNA G1207 methylase RsmC
VLNGKFRVVAQRETWYRNKLHSIFGNVRERLVSVYRVFEATKGSHSMQTPSNGLWSERDARYADVCCGPGTLAGAAPAQLQP